MTRRLCRDPLVVGPQRLLTEKDRPALDKLIDKLQADLTAAIVQRVSEGASQQFARGYRTDELQILGFGPEITVEPRRKLGAVLLWWRRRLLQFQIATIPKFRDYGNIEAEERDTRRLITQLKIFETHERPNEDAKGVVTYERRI